MKYVCLTVESIDLGPDFSIQSGATFTARLWNDSEGVYMYDAIGNLIEDYEQKVSITWTPYGKVREVRNDADTVVVTFLYDDAGNRVYRKVVKPGSTTTTHYARDASGNVMAVYSNTEVSEFNIYGSSRLGQYKGGVREGHQTLGKRNYELTNHLGNVLAVITDNVDMVGSDFNAIVAKSTDYYAFGLDMEGRNFTDERVYRYGFNGKEKDDEGEVGDTSYDYGFRIFNPRIGRFLSTDPLISEYAALTPYQFASNSTILGIDRDGLEFEPYWASTVPRQQREYEAKLRESDPKNAEKTILQHNFNAMLVVGGSWYAGALLFELPTAGTVLTNLYYRGLGTAMANPEVVIGTTGLVGSILDPNPNSDYPGNFDDVLRGGKLLLGKAYIMKQYAPRVDDAYHMFKDGFGLGISKVLTPANQVMQAMYQAIAKGKKIAFDLTDVSLDAAKRGFKNFGEANEMAQITEWELSKILRDKDLYENTIFHQGGKAVKAEDLGLKYIEE